MTDREDQPSGDFESLLDAGDRLYALERYDDALGMYERAIKGATDDSQRAEAYCAIGDGLLAMGRAGESIYMYSKAVDLDEDFAGGYCGQADVQFERWDFDQAMKLARQALRRDPDYARAHYLLGLILEKSGDEEGARSRFRRAAGLDPEYYPLPLDTDEGGFAELVTEAVRTLPDEGREFMEAVELVLEAFPNEEDADHYRENQIGPQVPGVLFEADDEGQTGPAEHRLRLVLYRSNLEKMATTDEGLVEEIQKTLLHEIADYYGAEEAASADDLAGTRAED